MNIQVKYSVLTTLLLSLLTSLACAQDFAKDMEKVYAVYEKAEHLYLKTKMTTQKEGKVVQEQTVEIRKEGEVLFYKLQGYEIFFSPEALIWIEHETKKVVYQAVPKGYYKKITELQASFDPQQLTTMYQEMVKNEQVEFAGEKEGVLWYWLGEKTQVAINASDYTLHKSIYTDNKQETELTYNQDQLKSTVFEKPLRLSDYVQKTKKGLKLHPSYKDYNLLILE